MTKKGTHRKSNYMERVHDYPKGNYMERVRDNKIYTEKVIT